jgi:hypothetical protein
MWTRASEGTGTSRISHSLSLSAAAARRSGDVNGWTRAGEGTGTHEEPSQPNTHTNPNPLLFLSILSRFLNRPFSRRRLESPMPSAGIAPWPPRIAPLPFRFAPLPLGFAPANLDSPRLCLDSPLPAAWSPSVAARCHQQGNYFLPSCLLG